MQELSEINTPIPSGSEFPDEEDDLLAMAGESDVSENGLYEHFRFTADAGQRQERIDKWIVDRIVGTSRSRVQKAADAGFIFVNGKTEKSSYKIKPGDVVSVMMDRPRHQLEILPEDIPLDIVYEDDALLVVNKPAGLVVHPGFGNFHGTLVNALAFHLKDQPLEEGWDQVRMGLVHRIDKDTSGLLVVAKTEQARSELSMQFFRKTSRRKYLALVWGHFDEDSGRIEGNIGRDPKDRILMTVFPPDSDQGKPAVTHWRVVERLGYVTLVECVLETGRTHQIRVHMKSIGHTLFNDAHYGGDRILKGTTFSKYRQFVQNCFALCPRQALHAQTLGFRHPVTGEELDFETPLPPDMEALIGKWRNYISNRNTE